MAVYIIPFRYEGSIEVEASDRDEAQRKAEQFADQELFLRMGDLEMDPPITKEEFRSGLLPELRDAVELRGGREG